MPSAASPTTPSTLPETLDAAATAELLQLDVRHVQRLARRGRLPGKRVGRKWLFFRTELEQLLRSPTTPASPSPLPAPPAPEAPGELSARNQLRGTVRSIRIDGLLAEVVLDIGGQEVVAVITRTSVERLGLRVGEPATAVMKATEVMVSR